MLYDKDPILPFQVVDKIDAISERMPELDPVQECFVQLENAREWVFTKATENIKKAQAHQTKCYNNQNGTGKWFEVGDKVLKKVNGKILINPD